MAATRESDIFPAPRTSLAVRWDRVDVATISVIVLLAAALRVAYVLQLRASPFFEHDIMDALYHDQWARAIVEGRTFQDGAYFRAPLYPWFLATLYRIFGSSYLAARLVQGLLGAVSCGLVFVLGRLLFSRGVALVAGLAAATYWVLIAFDAELLIPVLIVFLDLCLLITLELGWRTCRAGWWFGSGLLLGLSAIAWPLVLLFAPPLAVWLLWLHRPALRRGTLAVVLVAGGCLIPILPVSVLNWRAGDAVLIATQGGVNFYIGNNRQSDGFTAIVPGTRPDWWGGYHDAIARAEAAEGRDLKGSEVSGYYYRQAATFFREHPGAALRLMARKLGYFWSWHEIPNNKDDQFVAQRFAPFMRFLPLGFWIVGPLGVLGLLLTLREPGRYFPLWGFVLVSMVGVVLFFVTGRYRVPVVPPLIVLASFAGFWLTREVKTRRYKALAGAGLALLLISPVVARTPSGSSMHPAEMLISMGRVLVEAGRAEEAFAYFQEALEREPHSAKAHYVMGVAEESRGRREEAADWYRRAIALQPDYAEAHNNLGGLLFDRRDYPGSLAEFEAAILSHADYAKGHINRGRALEALERVDEALAAYARGLSLDPENVDGWIRAILFSGRHGRSAATLDLAQRAAAASGRRHAGILDLLAEAQFMVGLRTDARATLAEAEAAARSAGDATMLAQIEKHRRSLDQREQGR